MMVTTVREEVRGIGKVKGEWLGTGAPAGFKARVGKSAQNFLFDTLVFSLPTLPYVTVAHPAHPAVA